MKTLNNGELAAVMGGQALAIQPAGKNLFSRLGESVKEFANSETGLKIQRTIGQSMQAFGILDAMASVGVVLAKGAWGAGPDALDVINMGSKIITTSFLVTYGDVIAKNANMKLQDLQSDKNKAVTDAMIASKQNTI